MKDKKKTPEQWKEENIICSKFYKSKNDNTFGMPPGDLNGSPDESLNSKNNETLVFIDEGFLAKLNKYFGRGKYIKFDKVSFSKNISKKQNLFLKQIYYYTAPPFQSNPPTKKEESLKEGYDEFVRNLKSRGVVVREGRCQRLKIDGEFIFRQKAVDIVLAMDLMSVLLKYPCIKKIILIVSDSDFVPVIKNLEENGVKTILYTYYEKKRNSNFSRSNDLIKSVYKYALLSKQDFLEAVLSNKKK